MKGVVLAAGAGTRMWPLATAKPKHLLPVAGRPIISFTLKALASAGINDLVMVVGFRAEQIKSALGDGAEYGLTIEYVRQPEWTGTASAIEVARDAVGSEPFLAIYGDLLVSQSCIESVLEKAREYSKVMGIVRVSNPSEYGVVEVKRDHVTRISEKPSRKVTQEAWVNSGVYVLDADVFRSIRSTPPSNRREYELTTSLQRMIKEGQELKAATISRAEWMDIGRPWDMLEANERLLMNFTPQVKGTVEPSVVIKGPVWLEETACIRSGSYIDGPAYIGEKSVVGPNARIRPCTSIGDEVNLGTSCEVKNSIIMSGSKVPHLSYIGDSVIGEKCNLAAGTITANIRLDEEPVTVNVKGKCVSSGMNKLGTIMGDQVQTGINSSIMPGVKIGASSYIGPGAVVYNDVPENCRVFARQSLVTKPGRTRSRE